MLGAWGKILRVDLTQETTSVVELEEEIYKMHLGGQTLGAYLMFKEGTVGPDVTAFDPRNALNFLIGPVTGIGPGGRSCVATKAPFNFNCAAFAGGLTPSELKFAGWDGIQVVGKASSPVYLAVVDDNVEIRDASHLWGKMDAEATEHEVNKAVHAPYEYRAESMMTTGEMPPLLAAKHPADPNKGIGNKVLARSWQIGRAGENMVWNSCISTEGARAHGRAGPGAVMGSKNLKAVAIRGTKGHPLHDKQTFMEVARAIQTKMAGAFSWREYGTASGWRNSMVTSCYPIRNWQEGSWEDPEALVTISGPFMRDASWVKQQACRGCLQKCLKTAKVNSKNPKMDGTITDMPDWEAMGVLGSNLGFIIPDDHPEWTPNDPYPGDVWDMHESQNKLLRATFIHDDLSLDYIDNGMNLGFLMELMQRGYITSADLDGIDLTWGNIDAVDEMVYKIATRDGIGDKLANGAYETAKYFAELKGKPEIMNYVMCTHRYGQPAHTVRGGCKSALSYLTVVKPNCHTEGSAEGEALVGQQDGAYMGNSLVICLFVRGTWGIDAINAMIKAATGWDWTNDDLSMVGPRSAAMCRIINLYTQTGDPEFTPQVWDGQAAWKWFNEPFTAGPWPKAGSLRYEEGLTVDKDKLYNEKLPEYWQARGWTTSTGIPTAAKLEELGISDVCGDMAAEMISKFGE